jgi:hypothetical protein
MVRAVQSAAGLPLKPLLASLDELRSPQLIAALPKVTVNLGVLEAAISVTTKRCREFSDDVMDNPKVESLFDVVVV